jgi:RNA 2',3'-cyclic 3'-phosphodiesterase
MRLFIAIELSDEIKNGLSGTVNSLKAAGADIKWVAPENMHVTLKFLGETAEEDIAKAVAILKALSSEMPGFQFTTSGAGAFPSIDSPRIIWAGISAGSRELVGMASKIEAGLVGVGFEKDENGFKPHITIGRTRSGRNLKKLSDSILSSKPEEFSQKVERICLISSVLGPNGPEYEKLEEYDLGK